MDVTIKFSSGELLPGSNPIVIIGPNGSGKTRHTRSISAFDGAELQFINALRNTRVAPELQATSVDAARANYNNLKGQSRYNHWEMSSDFDWMLAQLLAQASGVALDFMNSYLQNPGSGLQPAKATLTEVQNVWTRIFAGRSLIFPDWKPSVRSITSGSEIVYSGNQMSDGEKAALYLIAQVQLANSGVVVIDEPETHFHSLLAVRLWDVLETSRPDIRFIYVTHDLTFALSRHQATFVLAHPVQGLKTVSLDESLPGDVAEALLGSASLSFYASRVIFCEGDEGSYDAKLYNAWFNGPDTVVRAVGSYENVIRCVHALNNARLVNSLTPLGIVDGDYHPDRLKEAFPNGVTVLSVHEVESLLSLPSVVRAICSRTRAPFKDDLYRVNVVSTVNDEQRKRIVVERWRASLNPFLDTVLNTAHTSGQTIEEFIEAVPGLLDHSTWGFKPQDLLTNELDHVNSVLAEGSIEEVLKLIPGKQVLPQAARITGLAQDAYTNLIINILQSSEKDDETLKIALVDALSGYLPAQYAAVRNTADPFR